MYSIKGIFLRKEKFYFDKIRMINLDTDYTNSLEIILKKTE
jgi:hypothetical protein